MRHFIGYAYTVPNNTYDTDIEVGLLFCSDPEGRVFLHTQNGETMPANTVHSMYHFKAIREPILTLFSSSALYHNDLVWMQIDLTMFGNSATDFYNAFWTEAEDHVLREWLLQWEDEVKEQLHRIWHTQQPEGNVYIKLC